MPQIDYAALAEQARKTTTPDYAALAQQVRSTSDNQAILDQQAKQFPTSAEQGGKPGAMMTPPTLPRSFTQSLPALTGGIVGAGEGAAYGAAVGSVLGPGGTAVGGFLGGIGGAGLGAMGGEGLRQGTESLMRGDTEAISPSRALDESKVNMEGEAGGRLIGPILGAAAGPLRTSAAEGMERVLNATTKANKTVAAKVAPELVDRGVMAATQKGLGRKLEAKVGEAGQALEEGYAALPQGVTVKTSPIMAAIEKSKIDSGAMIPGANGMVIAEPTLVQAADDLKDIVSQFGPDVSVDSLVKLRQRWDKTVSMAKGFTEPNIGMVADMKRDATNAIRQELAKEFPDIAKLNAEYSFWKKSSDIVNATIQRKAGQSVPMGEQIAQAAGGAVGLAKGGVGGAISMATAFRLIRKATTSTGWRTVSSQTKNLLARALASDNQQLITAAALKATIESTRGPQ